MGFTPSVTGTVALAVRPWTGLGELIINPRTTCELSRRARIGFRDATSRVCLMKMLTCRDGYK